MSYTLIKYPDELLKSRSKSIDTFDKDLILTTTNDMILAMIENRGLGLSAIQIGIPLRMMVIKTIQDSNLVFLCICNPVIEQAYGKIILEQEGCLSFPGIYAPILRHESIKLQWQNPEGQEYVTDFTGIDARCIQHEIDHMNGVSFVDKLPDFRRIKIQKQLTDLRKLHARSYRSLSQVN